MTHLKVIIILTTVHWRVGVNGVFDLVWCQIETVGIGLIAFSASRYFIKKKRHYREMSAMLAFVLNGLETRLSRAQNKRLDSLVKQRVIKEALSIGISHCCKCSPTVPKWLNNNMAGTSLNESFIFWLHWVQQEQAQFPELISLRRFLTTSRFLLLEWFH